jgi:DnaJ-class molecular chaperone
MHSATDFGYSIQGQLPAASTGERVIVAYFDCQSCHGHGAKVKRNDDGTKRAVLCTRCNGEGRLGATEDEVADARAIGSDNPFCRHEWAGGNEDYDRCYCLNCGADGDA